MEIFFDKILEKKNHPIIKEEYNSQNHLILSKYISKKYYNYSLEMLRTLLEKSEYYNEKIIFHISLFYLLKILYNFKNKPYIDNYDLLILTSFSLAIKVTVNQHKIPFISKLKYIYPEKYSQYNNEEIEKCEIICLKLLDYDINILTPFECLYFLFKNNRNKLSLLIKELENIIFNDVNDLLFKKPYELVEESIYRLNLNNQNIMRPLLIREKTPIILQNNYNKERMNNDSTTTTSVSSYRSYKNSRKNFNSNKLKILRSQSISGINSKNNAIINKNYRSMDKEINRQNFYPVYATIEHEKKINNNKNEIKKVIYNDLIDKYYKKEEIINNNIKLLTNCSIDKSISENININNSSNKNLSLNKESVNFNKNQINNFLYSYNTTLSKRMVNLNSIKQSYSKVSLIKNNNRKNNDKTVNNLISINIKNLGLQNISENIIFKKPTINKKNMKTSFRSNKKINKNFRQKNSFYTIFKNCNNNYEKISDLCKKINFEVFNSITDRDKTQY